MLLLNLTPAMSRFSCIMLNSLPVIEVEELTLTGPQLNCVSGCSIMDVTTVNCHNMEEMEREEVEMSNIHLSDKLLHCVTTPLLPPSSRLQLISLDCQFCDTMSQQLVHDSCILRFSLSKVSTGSYYDNVVAMVLIIILISLLVMLYKEIMSSMEKDKSKINIRQSIRKEEIKCECEGERGEKRREEEIFQQSHSFLGRKRRKRSRSRRREVESYVS